MDISDAVALLGCLFLGTACPECRPATDYNNDGTEDISDAIAALSHLFLGGLPPPRGKGCQVYASCRVSEHCR
jgi:hypothetical protein